jgi:hypothetical protein
MFLVGSKSYAHALRGKCPCGKVHAPADPLLSGEKRKRRIERVYQYRNAEGVVVFEVLRYKPKDFRQRRPTGNGDFAWNLDGVERVLYNLPKLLAADPDAPVWIPEGEKDVEALDSLGAVATTNPGGAGKWRDTYSETLRDRHCLIVPDNDDDGRSHSQQIARSLDGVARSIKIIELPHLPRRGT